MIKLFISFVLYFDAPMQYCLPVYPHVDMHSGIGLREDIYIIKTYLCKEES